MPIVLFPGWPCAKLKFPLARTLRRLRLFPRTAEADFRLRGTVEGPLERVKGVDGS
jgi:hypothetical protein